MGEAIQTYQSQSYRSYILSGTGQFLLSVKEDKIQEGGGGALVYLPHPCLFVLFLQKCRNNTKIWKKITSSANEFLLHKCRNKNLYIFSNLKKMHKSFLMSFYYNRKIGKLKKNNLPFPNLKKCTGLF